MSRSNNPNEPGRQQHTNTRHQTEGRSANQGGNAANEKAEGSRTKRESRSATNMPTGRSTNQNNDSAEHLENMTDEALQQQARERGIEGSAQMNKKELINALRRG